MQKEANERKIIWNLCKSFAIQTFTPNLEELPDLIIYLTQKEKEICFQRIKLKDFHLNDDIVVIKLLPEPCVGIVKEITGIAHHQRRQKNDLIEKHIGNNQSDFTVFLIRKFIDHFTFVISFLLESATIKCGLFLTSI